jgi:hypothetical protein
MAGMGATDRAEPEKYERGKSRGPDAAEEVMVVERKEKACTSGRVKASC